MLTFLFGFWAITSDADFLLTWHSGINPGGVKVVISTRLACENQFSYPPYYLFVILYQNIFHQFKLFISMMFSNLLNAILIDI